jgi:hypothetical protein
LRRKKIEKKGRTEIAENAVEEDDGRYGGAEGRHRHSHRTNTIINVFIFNIFIINTFIFKVYITRMIRVFLSL